MKHFLSILKEPRSVTWLQRIVFVAILVFYAILVTYQIQLPAAEDLPRQMKNGEEILRGDFRSLTQNLYSYTQTDHYFANHHWLYGVFAYGLHWVVGWNGMVIFKVLFILSTFAMLFRAALRKADFWLVAVCSIPAVLMLVGRSALRPELFGYFFIALYAYLLIRLDENPRSKAIYWLIPCQILWANLHITFPIGVMLLGGYFVEKIILYRKDLKNNPLIRRIAVLLVVLAAVSFLNPLGIKGVIYSLTINTQDGPVVSREVQPLFTANDDSPKSNFFPLGGLVPLFVVSLVSFIVAYRKRHIFYFLGILASGLLTYKVIRSFPFFAIFFLLAMSANLNDIFLRAKNYLNTRKPFTWIGVEVVVTCLVIVGLTMGSVKYLTSVGCGDFGIGLARNAEDAAKFFVDNKIKGPILNDTDVGSYLIWYLYPQEKVFADNRFGDAYSDDFFANDYKPLFSDEKKWQEMKEKYQFNSIFLYQYNLNEVRDFIFRRINDPEWVFVYGDRYNVILVKNAPENQTVIDRFAIRHDNVMARFSHLINSLDSADLVAVGDLFGLMGQIPWARTAYASAVSQTPNWPKIWFVMGRLELTRGDTQNSDLGLALLFLHQAIDRGWKTVNAYSYLALAYYRLNQLDKAEAAVREELKLNPKSDDANVWLVKLAEARARQVVEK